MYPTTGTSNQRNYAEAQVAPPRDTIGSALESQAKYIEDLHNALSRLCDRLTPVLSPDGPSNGATSGTPVPSGVLGVLRMNGEQLHLAIDRIEQLQQRILL